jgi:hypothetical protein
MGWQLIAMGMGMSMVPWRKIRPVLGVMLWTGMRMIQGMVLVQPAVTVRVRARPGSRPGRLGIIGLAVWSVSWRHSLYLRSHFIKTPASGEPGQVAEFVKECHNGRVRGG